MCAKIIYLLFTTKHTLQRHVFYFFILNLNIIYNYKEERRIVHFTEEG